MSANVGGQGGKFGLEHLGPRAVRATVIGTISRSVATGWVTLPTVVHQRTVVAVANPAVSWSVGVAVGMLGPPVV